MRLVKCLSVMHDIFEWFTLNQYLRIVHEISQYLRISHEMG